MFGCPAREALGRSIERFIPERFRSAHRGHVDRFGKTGTTARRMGALGSISGLRVNGEAFPVEASISQMVVGGHRLFTVILRDITERKRGEEAQGQLAAIVTSSSDAIVSKSLNGTVTTWNEGAADLLGYRASEMIGQSIRRLIPGARQAEEEEILARIATGEHIEQYDTIRLQKDGRAIDVSITISPIRDPAGMVTGAATVMRDITDRKRAEEGVRESEKRLQRWNEQLEQGVAERTQELTQSQERLRALATELNLAEQRERTRLANDLHDYLAQLLVLGRITLAQAKRSELPSRAEKLIKETEETLDKALNYCRTLMAELSPPVLQERGLSAGLIWLGEHMKRQDLEVTVKAETADSVMLPEDRAVLLFQSVRELLMNVAKHGAVKQAVVTMTHQERLLTIVVRDENGFDLAAGAAAATISPLSSKFGLFSIRERMKALGGTFAIESERGKGTTATLTLPLPVPTDLSSQNGVASHV